MKIPRFISNILIRRGFNRLRRELQRTKHEAWSVQRTMDFLFSRPGDLIRPWQFRGEMEQLADELSDRKPSTIVEIGTANGGTLFMASRVAADDALLVSIDLPEGPYGGGYPESKIPVYKSFARAGQRIELIRDDSHDPRTYEQLISLLGTRRIDYLFIDGDHTYEGAKQDFENYSKLVAPGGLIVFHDIVVHPDLSTNVNKLWMELKEKYTHREFVRDWGQRRFGIGVLHADEKFFA